MNETALNEYKKELNSQANVRDYMMSYLTNLSITTASSIQLQSSSLAHLTQAPSQLTRSALVIIFLTSVTMRRVENRESEDERDILS